MYYNLSKTKPKYSIIIQEEEEEEDEGYNLSKTKPKYAVILQEEEYEDEDDPQGFDGGPEDNYAKPRVETWDPWEASYFFPIR